MKSKVRNPKLQKLSLSIGDFIRYWGFRRIHGAIWTQVYVSRRPLSVSDLVVALGLSKALISPAVEELVHHRLIKEVPSPNEKTRLYEANPNISDVIHHVLKTREALMLKKITKDFTAFSKDGDQDENVDPLRVQNLGEMVLAANLMLSMMLEQEDILKLPMDLQE